MPRGSICEPVVVNPEAAIRVEQVATSPDDAPPDRFAHFHDAAELVWFRAVAGELIGESGAIPLRAGSLVFVPPMRPHDFAIPAGRHAWVLAHLDPFLVARLAPRDAAAESGGCRAAVFAGAMAERVDALFAWLAEAAAAGRRELVAALVGLILAALAGAEPESPEGRDAALSPGKGGRNGVAETGGERNGVARLRPALDLIARDPAQAFTLRDVATACHLSEAYFSRSFKRVFGSTFSAYLRDYRLRLAAQRLLAGDERVSVIAHQSGFASPAHMTEQFRRRFGLSPTEYRAARRPAVPAGQARDSD